MNCESENTKASNVCKVCFVTKGSRGALEAKDTKKPVHPRHAANVICDAETCAVVCRLLAKCDTLAIDCEGVNLGRPGGRLCLIQIAGSCGVYLFDGLADDFALLMDAGLRSLLENPQIVKVIHDCKMDACALFMLNGTRLSGVFDTQLAFSLMEKNQKSVSLADLIKTLTGKIHPHKESAPHKRDPLFWSRRELVIRLSVFRCLCSNSPDFRPKRPFCMPVLMFSCFWRRGRRWISFGGLNSCCAKFGIRRTQECLTLWLKWRLMQPA